MGKIRSSYKILVLKRGYTYKNRNYYIVLKTTEDWRIPKIHINIIQQVKEIQEDHVRDEKMSF
jgi:hypothetical protein